MGQSLLVARPGFSCFHVFVIPFDFSCLRRLALAAPPACEIRLIVVRHHFDSGGVEGAKVGKLRDFLRFPGGLQLPLAGLELNHFDLCAGWPRPKRT